MSIITEIEAEQQALTEAVAQALTFAEKENTTAEVAVNKTIGISVSSRFSEVENIEFNNDGALGITVYYQQCKGYASTTNLSKKAILSTVESARDIARYTSADPFSGLAEKERIAFSAPDLDLFYPQELDTDWAIKQAILAEDAARNSDKRITNTEGANYNSHCSIRIYGNSHGMLQSYLSSRHSLSSSVIAEQQGNMERDYAYTIARDAKQLQTPEWVGRESARRVLARLSAQPLATMTTPVIFSSEVAASLWGHLAGAINGNSLYRHSSFLLNSLNKKILPDWLNIQEDPHELRGLGSAPFDGEGVLTQKRSIVEAGVLTSYLLSSYSAKKLGMATTGHADGIYNWSIDAPLKPLEALLKEMGRGLLVTELMGQGVNIVNGDYSRGAFGFWVENGEIQYPVNEITIAGNLQQMLQSIVAVGSDTEMRRNIRSGSLLIESMTIAGK